MGYEPRADLPIYIAALSPKMLRLAGEIGDGVMLWLCNPDYIRDVVVPEVREGRERAGKTLEGFDIVAGGAVGRDRRHGDARLRDAARRPGHLLRLPFYRAMIERSGFGDDIAAFDEGMEEGDVERRQGGDVGPLPRRPRRDRLAGRGPRPESALPDAGATSPGVGAVPRTDFEATLEAAKPAQSG